MKITHVTIRRLKSQTVGFGHVAVEMTVEIDYLAGETVSQVVHDLRDRVDNEVRGYLDQEQRNREREMATGRA